MIKEDILVVGLGEVGRPLFELLKESTDFNVYCFDLDEKKMQEIGQRVSDFPSKFSVMHVCIPCFNKGDYVSTIVNYVERFNPRLLIINSTVEPGVTLEVHKHCSNCLVVHSPVRGVHKSKEYMKKELKRWTKYIGGATPEAAELAEKHFRKLGLKTKVVKSCVETELAKLFETTYRAWMIACFQEMHRISQNFGASFDDVADFIEDTHRLRHDRPVMFPGVIGGHCQIPNIKLLLRTYESKFLRIVLESNEKRKEEIKNPQVVKEIEEIKKRVEANEKLIAAT
ncbi:GDP-mannose dehydrogenase [Candidatus Bathyarchaeota archaeon]|nr:GDP-mannose dehydrogenase [Candidatus Bathyarchaeota archaeon]